MMIAYEIKYSYMNETENPINPIEMIGKII